MPARFIFTLEIQGGGQTDFVVSSFGKREAGLGAAGRSECGGDTRGGGPGTAEVCLLSLACVRKVFAVTLAVRLP